jgi:tetratricopeptide (TPR) repeat protein
MQEMKERWLGLSPEGWHSLVVGLLRDRQLEAAMDKLEQMQADQIDIQPWLYDIFMFQLCEADELDEVLRILKYRFEHHRSDILPTMWYYVLDAFASSMHVSQTLLTSIRSTNIAKYAGLKYVWKQRVQTTIINPSDGICVAALNIAARNSDPGLATSVIRILSARRSALAPFHYEALLTAYTGFNDLKTSFRILVIMSKSGLEPDSSTTRPLYVYLTRPGSPSPKSAWGVLKELSDDGHVIPVAAANVVLESCVQLDYFDEAVELYKELYTIVDKGPNVDTFNVLLQGAARRARKDLSMFLASEMHALNIRPNLLTYDRLILACLAEDDYEDAFRYLEEMIAVGTAQAAEGGGWWMRKGTATLMAKKCVETSDERVWSVLDEMDRRGMRSPELVAHVKDHWKGLGSESFRKGELSAWGSVV